MIPKLPLGQSGPPPFKRFRQARMALLATGAASALIIAPVTGFEFARADSPVVPTSMSSLPSLAPLVKKVMPAVVNISVLEGPNADDEDADTAPGSQSMPEFPPGSPFNEFLRKFFQGQGINPNGPQSQAPQTQKVALGSGFIIDPSGLVVTNNHVVDGAKKVTVVLQDGSKYSAKIVGRDPKTDLALLEIDAGHSLPYVSWGDSNAEQVGDWVVAVGNPFGLGGTVSAGIVSARERDINSGPYDDFLQIDAPINRGNSGGPTFNLQGQVIGINTAIYSPNGGSVGIGFAIPSNLAKPIVDQLHKHGKVIRGWLGVQVQQITPALAKGLGLSTDHGALVADVTKKSPADKAGIKPGDVIESFDGHEIMALRDLPIMVAEAPVGNSAQVKVWRKGQDLTLNLTVAEQPGNPQMAANGSEESGTPEHSKALGVTLARLTPGLHSELHVPAGLKGVVIRSIAQSSPLANLDILPGDVIVSIDQEPVTTPKEALTMLSKAVAAKNVLLLINRHGMNEYVAWSDETNQG